MQDLLHQLLEDWDDTRRNLTPTAAQTASGQARSRDAWGIETELVQLSDRS